MSEEAPLPPASDEGAGDRMDTGEEGPVAEDRDEQTDDGQNPAEEIDLKKMADDYARYLIVNSKQDVSEGESRIQFCGVMICYSYCSKLPWMIGLMVYIQGDTFAC